MMVIGHILMFVIAEAEYSLTETVTIPSHEDVDNDSLSNLLEFESGLQPVAALPPAEIG